ncbi:MAG: hypothetical protein ACRDTE_11735 [Pseudonocardiaceae bacterium]
MIDPRIPLTERSLQFAAGTFHDMVHTRDAQTCARAACVARAALSTSQHPLLSRARAAWWAAVADYRAAAEGSDAERVSSGRLGGSSSLRRLGSRGENGSAVA